VAPVSAADDQETFRPPLNRPRVLRAAVAVADADGLGALTMRGLAAELGFEVMSLYNHVANKNDLLAGMVDLVLAEAELPAAEDEWRSAMRRSVLSTHEVLSRHPWAAPLWAGGLPGPALLTLMDAWLATLARSGLDPETAHRGFHALSNHVVGFALQEPGVARGQGGRQDGARAFVDGLPPGAYPHFVAHVHEHLAGRPGGNSFAFVLDLILDGLAAARRDRMGA